MRVKLPYNLNLSIDKLKIYETTNHILYIQYLNKSPNLIFNCLVILNTSKPSVYTKFLIGNKENIDISKKHKNKVVTNELSFKVRKTILSVIKNKIVLLGPPKSTKRYSTSEKSFLNKTEILTGNNRLPRLFIKNNASNDWIE